MTDLFLHVDLIHAAITCLTIQAGFGPAHARELEPVLSELHLLIRDGNPHYVKISKEKVDALVVRLRNRGQHWKWLIESLENQPK